MISVNLSDEDGEGRFQVISEEETTFEEHFDRVFRLLTYGHYCMFTEICEELGVDPYDTTIAAYYEGLLSDAFMNMHEKHKDLPPIRDLLKGEDEDEEEFNLDEL